MVALTLTIPVSGVEVTYPVAESEVTAVVPTINPGRSG